MSKAEKVELVDMVVTGGKRYSANDADGVPYFAQPGDTVKVSLRTAKVFKHCLTAPGVVTAQAAVEVATAEAEEEATETEAAPERKVIGS